MGKTSKELSLFDLPPEIHSRILSFLDGESLKTAAEVCQDWGALSKSLWKPLCVFPPSFPRSLLDLSESASQSPNWKSLYHRLSALEASWDLGKPHSRLIDCSRSLTSEASRMSMSGIYDMVHTGSKLVLSIYDSLEVLDLNGESLLVLSAESLDSTEYGKARCFYANESHLLVGTESGNIKVFDLGEGQLLCVCRRSPEALSDIRIKDGVVYIIDIRGNLSLWSLEGSQLLFRRELSFQNISSPYYDRNRDRLLDTDGRIIASSFNSCLIIAPLSQAKDNGVLKDISEFSNLNPVLCFVVFGSQSLVAAGTHGGWVYLYGRSGSCSHYSRIGAYRTPFEDNITSISALGENRIIFGDVNAEIRCIKIWEDSEGTLTLNQSSHVFTLDCHHQYGSYIWAVKVDAARIYSGNSNCHLTIHDFWDSILQ